MGLSIETNLKDNMASPTKSDEFTNWCTTATSTGKSNITVKQ